MARREDKDSAGQAPLPGPRRGPQTPRPDPAQGQAGELVQCPHCGRLVLPEAPQAPRRPAAGERVFRCPSCGLQIKERHLA